MKTKTKTEPKLIDLSKQTYTKQAQIIHKIHAKWWQDPKTGKPIERDADELLLLVVTEIAEATEGLRKSLKDDKLKHRSMEEVEMADAYIRLCDFAGGFLFSLAAADNIKDGYPVLDSSLDTKTRFLFEIVIAVTQSSVHFEVTMEGIGKAVSRCMSMIRMYCSKFGFDLEGAINEKLAFNMKRKDHTHAARRGKHGKAF